MCGQVSSSSAHSTVILCLSPLTQVSLIRTPSSQLPQMRIEVLRSQRQGGRKDAGHRSAGRWRTGWRRWWRILLLSTEHRALSADASARGGRAGRGWRRDWRAMVGLSLLPGDRARARDKGRHRGHSQYTDTFTTALSIFFFPRYQTPATWLRCTLWTKKGGTLHGCYWPRQGTSEKSDAGELNAQRETEGGIGEEHSGLEARSTRQ